MNCREKIEKAPSRKALNSVDLFTGAGGIALGAHKAGFRHTALVEWDKNACATLRTNVGSRTLRGISKWRIIEGDVRSFDYQGLTGQVDLVAGGPPCQPFSIGGKHRGMTDKRDMIPEFIRALRELKPRAFLFENVKGLTRQAFQNYLFYIQLQMAHPNVPCRETESWSQHLERLEDRHTQSTTASYQIITRLVNSADYGVPQTRERLFIVGFRSDLAIDWHFPTPTHSQDRLLYDQWITKEYWKRHDLPVPSLPVRLERKISKLSRIFPLTGRAWTTLRDAIHDLPDPVESGEESELTNHRLQRGAKAYVGHTGSPLDSPSKTLKAGVHGVPGGENMIAFSNGQVRYLTVREAARVQTFPDSWRFAGAWSETMRQLGNAAPMLLVEKLAHSIAERLQHSDGQTLRPA